jgi:hypothetical protein
MSDLNEQGVPFKPVDRAGWDNGPWDTEPDRVEFKTQVGLPAIVLRSRYGNLCGYVGVTKEHPFYNRHYDDPAVQVHGGLTYAAHCKPEFGICHVPESGEDPDVYWFGFDCAHGGDLSPGMDALLPADLKSSNCPSMRMFETYRSVEYVKGECEDLARQLVAMLP